MKLAVYTLGCKVNQYESRALINEFIKNGFEITEFDKISDVYIINTCSVTNVSDKKSRQMINRAVNLNKNALICVTGCYSQLSKEEVEKIKGVDIITGTKNKMELVSLVKENIGKKTKITKVYDVSALQEFEPMETYASIDKTRISIKIQDGCENFCSYCVIPYARGKVRSKNFKKIEKELFNIIKNGYKEIILTGIHISSYDFSSKNLLDVLKMADKMEGDFRIRLGSLNLSCFSDEFIDNVSKLEKLCPHFHISLQSGCDQTLKEMNRNYTARQFLSVIKKIKVKIKDAAITTDVIVGFPGENDEQFNQSLEFVKSAGFSDVHIFPYSIRKGTKAALMKGRVDSAVKKRREKILKLAAAQSREEFLKNQLGKTMDVLFEQCNSNNYYEGFTPNYLRVSVFSKDNVKGKVKKVLLNKIKNNRLCGQIV